MPHPATARSSAQLVQGRVAGRSRPQSLDCGGLVVQLDGSTYFYQNLERRPLKASLDPGELGLVDACHMGYVAQRVPVGLANRSQSLRCFAHSAQ